MGQYHLRPAGFALLLAAIAAPAAGQGSSVYNQGACASARGGAVIAAPCRDASSIYYSPGALALLPSTVSAGFTGIYNSGSFTYDTTGATVDREGAIPLVPQGYVSYRFGADQRFAAGVGVWAPYGLTIEWPESFEGRFSSWRSALQGIYIQPTLALQIIPGKLGIGAGPQIVLGGIEINQHVDAPVASPQLALLGVPLGTDLAKAELTGSGTGYGFQVGAFYRPTERLAFGARYMHKVKVDLSGDADFDQIMHPDLLLVVDVHGTQIPFDQLVASEFAPGGPLTDQTATASLTFPAQAVVGVNYQVLEDLGVEFDYEWTGWNVFDKITAEFSNGSELPLEMNYQNTSTYRAGFTWTASPNLDVIGGFSYNGPAAPDESVTPILPDAARQIYGAGIAYRVGKLEVDGYYSYVNQADRQGRVRSTLPGITNLKDLNVGVFSNVASQFGLTFGYVFGSLR